MEEVENGAETQRCGEKEEGYGKVNIGRQTWG